MFCSNCGKAVREGAKFCGNCGTPVEVPNVEDIIAPVTAAVPEAPAVETASADGSVIDPEIAPSTPAEDTAPVQTQENISAKAFVPGTELYKLKMVDKCRGTSNFSASLGNGTLHVYDNGMQFKGIFGASVGSGVLGAIASTVINISEAYDPNTYPLEQIKELRVGKRLGISNTLVISMKNGDVWSFCPALPGSSAPKQIVSILKPYMDKLNG